MLYVLSLVLFCGAATPAQNPAASAGGPQMQHSPGFLALVEDARGRIREVTVEQVRERQQKGAAFEFIDVREDNEWDKGYAAGARHVGRGVLERDIETLVPSKDREIILYCGGGFRSALTADNLQKMGYRKVYSMAGGIREWRARNLPEEKPQPK